MKFGNRKIEIIILLVEFRGYYGVPLGLGFGEANRTEIDFAYFAKRLLIDAEIDLKSTKRPKYL